MPYESAFTSAQSTAYTLNQVDTAIVHKGWFNDFGHWHTLRSRGVLPNYDTLLTSIKTRVGATFAWYCRPGEAIEYMYARSSVSAISATQSAGSVIVSATYSDPFAGTDTSGFSFAINKALLQTPISARIDLTGTPLAGGFIQASYGKVISKGSNVYLIEIPLDSIAGNFSSVTLSTAIDNSDYYTTTRPTVSTNLVGSTLTVTTDIPTRCAVFSVATGGAEIDMTNFSRHNTLSTTHTFTLTAGKDYRAGVISEFQQANLSTLISY